MSVRDVCVCDLQFGMRSGGGSKASFSAFVDPRVYGTSPTEDDEKSSAAGTLPETLPPLPPHLKAHNAGHSQSSQPLCVSSKCENDLEKLSCTSSSRGV